ncbi:RHS repeat domain-containing protein [Taibaiella koreensis]|uniref:RHS repeat domain-containing protein n=1 Tax=Taibaiella koreensis TaxID=1268548 RepID=UPI000E5A05E9|nr:RHS repeat domain-containing protein [Taibaiella koreensis]
MKSKYLLAVLLMLSNMMFVNAQTDDLSYGRKYKIEETGSLLKQVPQFATDKFDVDYTGMTAIGIDLYTLEEDGVKIPIRLTYNPNATKIDDRASWVGFGWSLDVGGYVGRSVNGTPDDVVITAKMGLVADTPDFTRIANPLRGYAISGAKRINNYNWSMNLSSASDKRTIYQWLSNSTNKFFKKVKHDIGAGWLYFEAGTLDWSVYNDEGFDASPDVFSYNLFGRSGKFVYSYSSQEGLTKPRTIPYDNIDISWSIDAATDYYNADAITNRYNMKFPYQTSGAYAFEIRDDNGCRYQFDVLDSSYITSSYYPSWGIGCGRDYLRVNGGDVGGFVYKKNDRWSISRLTTAHGREIHFTYQQDTSTSVSISRRASNMDFVNNSGFSPLLRNHNVNVAGSNNFTNKIKSIETDNERIDFILSDAKRQDVTTSKQLERIIIYRKTRDGVVEKYRVEFGYDYFNTNNDPRIDYTYAVPLRPGGNVIYDNQTKKLKLTSLQFKSGSTVTPPYRFTYNESAALPRQFSVKRDLYGYYNGSNNVTSCTYPKMYVYPNKTGTDKYTINRRPDWVVLGETEVMLDGADASSTASMTIGTLSRITTPTDGYIDYRFEPNDYLWFNNTIKGGGMRIKSITTNPNITGSPAIVRNYTYTRATAPLQSSGKLLNAPIIAYGENHCGYEFEGVDPSAYARDSPDYIKRFTWRLEMPEFSGLIDAGNPVVGYEEVTEQIPGKGKTVYTFWAPGQAGTPAIEPQYTNAGSGIEDFNNMLPLVRVINGGGYYEMVPPSQDASLFLDVTTPMDLAGVDASEYSYYAGPKINLDWARGMISSKKQYTSSNTLTYEENFQYQVMSPGQFGPVYIPALKQGNIRVYNMPNIFNTYDDMFATNCMYYTYFLQLANVKMALRSVEAKDYGTVTGGPGPVSTTTVYTYANNTPANLDPYPRAITTVNSDGTSLTKRFKYPRDYVGSINGISGNLLNGIPLLLSDKKYSSLVESWNEQAKSGSTAIQTLGADLNEYAPFANAPAAGVLRSRLYKLNTNTPLSGFSPSSITGIGAGTSFNKDPRYQLEQELNKVDYQGNGLQRTESRTGRVIASVMGYQSMKPVATVDNAALSDIAFSGFDEPPYPPLGTIDDSKGNWEFDPEFLANNPLYPPLTGNFHYGLFSENGSPAIALHSELLSVNALQSGKPYVLSFWVRDLPGPVTVPNVYNGNVLQAVPAHTREANGWFYYEIPLTGTGNKVRLETPMPSTVGMINNLMIDEARLYPADAAMRTLAYDPATGAVTTSIDESGNVTYYEYDGMGRLVRQRDANKNVTRQYTYQYKAQ